MAFGQAMGKAGELSPRTFLLGGFLLSFLAAGTPFWLIPYSQLTVPDGFFSPGLAVVFAVATLLCMTAKAGFGVSVLVPAVALPAAMMARVIVEGLLDPTRHKLWPLALVIALFLGLLISGAGALIGYLLARVWR